VNRSATISAYQFGAMCVECAPESRFCNAGPFLYLDGTPDRPGVHHEFLPRKSRTFPVKAAQEYDRRKLPDERSTGSEPMSPKFIIT
jgi:hypothetical protein